jgi:hypothetical protein
MVALHLLYIIMYARQNIGVPAMKKARNERLQSVVPELIESYIII